MNEPVWDLWVVGGDARQCELADLLAEDGHIVHTYALERAVSCRSDLSGIAQADGVILPLPVLDGRGALNTPLSDRTLEPARLFGQLLPGQRLLAGRPGAELCALAASFGLGIADYYASEEIAVLNAIPTAEGAVRLAMDALSVTLHEARCVIAGFGRVGQALAARLAALGCRVWVSERSRARQALAQSQGLDCGGFDRLPGHLSRAQLVFNTVPAVVFGPAELSALPCRTPLIELASPPGGVDLQAASALGIRLIPAPGLPGKTAPRSAARYLRDAVYSIMLGV